VIPSHASYARSFVQALTIGTFDRESDIGLGRSRGMYACERPTRESGSVVIAVPGRVRI
jgi:hypothetical protein